MKRAAAWESLYSWKMEIQPSKSTHSSNWKKKTHTDDFVGVDGENILCTRTASNLYVTVHLQSVNYSLYNHNARKIAN